jgi:ParB family chromosome partitioning protein
MAAFKGDSIFWIDTNKIVPNPFQPRREFDEARLKELAESIRMYGVLQPLTVSRKEVHGEDGSFRTEYELIAGERRLRASKLAGVEQVPVIIREGEDSEQEKLELAIIENLQREDLNAVDRALAFKQLADMFNLSHAQVAKKVGRSREYVSNSIRLLNLPEYMLESVKTADISEGHARTLLMLNDRPEEQDTLYREILLKKLTVREVERIARKIATDKVRKQKWQGTDPELIEKEKQFTETLGTRVQLTKTDYGGKITIDYFSDEDLDLLLATIARNRAAGVEPSVSAVTSAAAAMSAATTTTERDAALDALSQSTPLRAESEAMSQPSEVFETPAPAETVLEPEQPAVEPDASAGPVADGLETQSTTSVPSSISTPAPAVVEAPVASLVQSATPTSSLRAKLSQLFSEPAQPVPQPTPEAAETAMPEPAVDTTLAQTSEPISEEITTPTRTQTPETPVEVPAPSTMDDQVATPVIGKSNDDEDLYGVKNFTV